MPYIGKGANGFGIRERYRYSATGGQTDFTSTDLDSKTLQIDSGSLIDVYLNGVLLDTADYNTNTANQITLTSGATASDEVMIVVYDVFSLSDAMPKTGGTFTGGITGTTGTFSGAVTANSTLDMNGTELILDADADTSITADTDDQIDFKVGGSDKMTLTSAGNLQLGSANDFSGLQDTLQLGDSQEFKLYHNGGGGNSVACILNTASSMQVFTDVIRFTSADNSESLFGADKNGAFFAKHDNATKIKTTSYGLEVQDDTDAELVLKSNESNANSSGARILWHDSDDSINHYVGMPSESNNDFYVWSVASGQFLIGLGNTHRFNIDASGNITASDTSIGSLSDERLKENIKDFSYSLSDFNKLKPRTFDWKNPDLHGGKEGIGFIAQELESVDTGLTYDYEITC